MLTQDRRPLPLLLRLPLNAILAIFLPFCCIPGVRAQVVSNEGHEFWIAFPSHEHDFDEHGQISYPKMSIFIAGKAASSGTVEVGTFRQRFTVSANGATEVVVPFNQSYININESNRVLRGRAIHVTTAPGQPRVSVYAHIYAAQRSAASLILPREGLSNRYFGMSYGSFADQPQNFLTVIATQPRTRIFFRRGNQELVPGGILMENVNDVYQFAAKEDLTGVRVESGDTSDGCERFALFTGSIGTSINHFQCRSSTIDPLFQQAYPVSSWGTKFAFIPFSMESPNFLRPVRQAGQHLRVVAGEDGTVVKIDGVTVATLNAGMYYSSLYTITTPVMIESNKPVTVAQFALSESCANFNFSTDENFPNYGDPDMLLLNPIAFGIDDITIFSSKRENIREQYINIVLHKSDAGSFRINGRKPSGTFKPMPAAADFVYLQQDLTRYTGQVFHLTAAGPFNASAYGFGAAESYAYAAGTNLAADLQLTTVRKSDKKTIDSACTEEPFYFELRTHVRAKEVRWQTASANAPVKQIAPAEETTDENGRLSFRYRLDKTHEYFLPGLKPIGVSADFGAGTCIAAHTETISNQIAVIEPPNAKFTASATGCPGEISFVNTDNTTTTATWDFGDSSSPASLNPGHQTTHTYEKPGTYIVHLRLTNTFGCQSEFIDSVQVGNASGLNITIRGDLCQGKAIDLTGQPTDASFAPKGYTWIFGDGDTLRRPDALAVRHRFKQGGIFHIRLIAYNERGCMVEADTNLTIRKQAIPGFSFSRDCGSSMIRFINGSTFEGQNVRYNWSFGDGAVSNAVSPVHRYVPGIYTVRLALTGTEGCDSTLSKVVTVERMTLAANFSLNKSQFCEGDMISLTDNTTSSATLSRLEWVIGVKGERHIINAPRAGSIYHYQLPRSERGSSSSDSIKLIIYSAEGCADSSSRLIKIYRKPRVVLDELANRCVSASRIRLNQGRETTGLEGNGYYSGPGVSTDGFFDPAAAGIGEHAIWYHFQSDGGCADSASRFQRVLPAPEVKLPEKVYVLKGKNVTLDPGDDSPDATYTWSPAMDLSDVHAHRPLANPRVSTQYRLIIEHGGCSATAVVQVIVLPDIRTVNTFTPNGDGWNDTWQIEGIEAYPDATVTIFNRYGQEVYFSKGYSTRWDGNYKGAPLPAGTYYYIIRTGQELQELKGFVTILR